MSALELPTQGIIIPGQGLVPMHVLQAQRAVEEYDKDLTIGQHDQTGEWVILLKRGPEGRPFPVFGLGPELPAPEALKKKLYEGDVRRHGGRIAEQLDRRQREVERAAKSERDQMTEEVAEAWLWAMRKEGKAQIPHIYVTGKKGE